MMDMNVLDLYCACIYLKSGGNMVNWISESVCVFSSGKCRHILKVLDHLDYFSGMFLDEY